MEAVSIEQFRHVKEENAVLKEQLKKLTGGETKPRGKMNKKELESEATMLEAELEVLRDRLHQRTEEANILQLSVKELAHLREGDAKKYEDLERDMKSLESVNQSKAERITTLEETLKAAQNSKETQLLFEENGKLAGQIETLTAALVGARADNGNMAMRVQTELSAREKVETERTALAEKLEDTQEALRKATMDLQARMGEFEAQRDSSQKLDDEVADKTAAIAVLNDQMEGVRKELGDAQLECRTLKEEHRIEVEEKDKLFAATSEELLTVKEQYIKAQTEVMEMMKGRVRLQNEHADWQAKRASTGELIDALNARISELTQQLEAQVGASNAEKAVLEQALAEARAEIASLQARVAVLEDDVARRTRLEADLRASMTQMETNLRDTQAAAMQTRREKEDTDRRLTTELGNVETSRSEVVMLRGKLAEAEKELDEREEERMRDAGGWLDDSACKECEKCAKKFSISRRRHHCRSCGHIFCNDCSQKRIETAGSKGKPVRVCADCFDSITDKRQRLVADTSMPRGVPQ